MSKSHVNIKLTFVLRKPVAEIFSWYNSLVSSLSENPREPAQYSTHFEEKNYDVISHKSPLTL